MPTKTDRILSYLPRTFQTSPRAPVLYAVADAFGNELLLAENSLAAVMLAHWVDFADKNAAEINDLEKMASLYGLAPRRDPGGESLESVEEFREHLKRYIRTFLEGTVTVQGILRVTAEALAVRIADETEQLDRWWTRQRDEVVTIESCGDDAAPLLRFERRRATGSPARPAQIQGSVDLSGGIDLQGASILRLKVDGVNLGDIDLAQGSVPPAPITLNQIVQTINQLPRPHIARHDGRYLILTSPATGPAGKLEVLGGAGDAAPRVLGLAPRSFHGAPSTAAELTGTVNLSSPVNLGNERFLRVEIDGKQLAEIDCADANASQTSLAHIRDAINQALGISVAGDDGKHLILKSPTKGFQSTISIQPPAAQNAANRLFGVATAFQTGRDAQPARVTGARDLRGAIDLSERSKIRLGIDGAPPVTINCAGGDPAKTQRVEIVSAINSAFNANIGTTTETGISLTSPTVGPASQIVFETAPGGDAASDIFGIGPLVFEGSAPKKARLAGTPILTSAGGVDLRARDRLLMAVNGGAPVEIDLGRAAGSVAELESVSLDKLTGVINDAFAGAPIAASDGEHLLLASPLEGGASRLEIVPIEATRRRRFVTRAEITDEAAGPIFGFISRSARGTTAAIARLTGVSDLSQSTDLRDERFLRLIVDGHPAVEIDCAGPRPRATTLQEVVENINAAFKKAGLTGEVAAHDGKHLVLMSPSSGSASRIGIEPPRVALETLLGLAPITVRGKDAKPVRFTGSVDLSAGIDLDPQAAIKLGFDGGPPVEISLAGTAPNHQSPFQIMGTINATLKTTVASTDGRRITLSSAKTGPESRIVFAAASGHDVTKNIFGFSPPREYHGEDAERARVEGARDFSGAIDVSVFRFLRLSVDGAPATDIDCAAKASNPKTATLAEIVQSIGPEIASSSANGKHLVLTSKTAGATGAISVEAYTAGDARKRLFGEVEDVTAGTSATPAVIAGTANLLGAVNLKSRGKLRIAVDGGRPIDIDVAGQVPAKTAADEIVAKINSVIPALAALTDDDHLKLTSPTAGEASSLDVLALRYLEVVEYTPQPAPPLVVSVRHSDPLTVVNNGAAEVTAGVSITAPQGTVGSALVNETTGWSVRLFTVVGVGETARISSDTRLGLRAEIVFEDGKTRSVPGSRILVGPLGAQTWVPFNGTWKLTGHTGSAPTLQLNNPLARDIVLLRAKDSGDNIVVSVTESDPSQLPSPAITGNDGDDARLMGKVRTDKGKIYLADANGNSIADLLAGPRAILSDYEDHVVMVTGPLYAYPSLMVVQTIARLFEVVLQSGPAQPASIEERYPLVTIGVGTDDERSLVRQLNAGSGQVKPSSLVHAEELDKATILNLPLGRTGFRYLDCQGSRFDQARFDQAYFPDGICGERGIFDVSRFTDVPPELVKAVFASADPLTDPPVKIRFEWAAFNPGTFAVNLPSDLPARFGGRFNEARFGQIKNQPETYGGAVVEPPTDDRFLTKLIAAGKSDVLKAAEVVTSVPLGWSPVKMPFRKPQLLTLGKPGQAAQLYLAEDGLAGFIKLEAKEEGEWGNEIAVSARQVGPAIYDVSVIYLGGRFENARSAVLGEPAGELTQSMLQAGPVGVLQAKAAGVRVAVTRDRAEYEQLTTTQ